MTQNYHVLMLQVHVI